MRGYGRGGLILRANGIKTNEANIPKRIPELGIIRTRAPQARRSSADFLPGDARTDRSQDKLVGGNQRIEVPIGTLPVANDLLCICAEALGPRLSSLTIRGATFYRFFTDAASLRETTNLFFASAKTQEGYERRDSQRDWTSNLTPARPIVERSHQGTRSGAESLRATGKVYLAGTAESSLLLYHRVSRVDATGKTRGFGVGHA
ncbi:hypothetical protein P175DRAFT_0527807 [Aspergillus ochraceoroseus IBT 24754]|uniref:Uncharacterized protein n=1 Tax=Aspergillus ochraceoroseus IBT 24754 TaxID=1392256 RepID=A0A2T5M732_9EURO|nr:uncharacterized protein P175DRAFT_0527807 [Aspergillus ochraceoroseus IBT 24754]PTU24345.1 hypothetical protein P175DRAFT_0527807 [Aspergillus ochraceoroseus IBT 24754]